MFRRLLFAAAISGAMFVLAGSATAGKPDTFSFQFVDNALCTFPLEVTTSGRSQDHMKLQQGREFFTGATKIDLRNLTTGRTAKLTSSGSSEFDYAAQTATFRGAQLATAAGIPIGTFTGQLQFSLADGTVLSRSGTKGTIDPCGLVDPASANVVPRTTPAPWPAPLNVLGGMKLAGLTPLFFNLAMHTHTHLDVIVNGAAVSVPAGIGIAEPAEFFPGSGLESQIGAISPLHTHFDDGILHVEADTGPFNLTLGQVFDEWQVRLTGSCLGSYCTSVGSSLRVYVNGSQVGGDPRSIALSSCSEIAVVYGPAGVPPSVPASYAWPLGCP